ncbi:MAG: hypothetical protein PHQ33_01150 [Bacteroidales bacterium]|nr:hypothetical protein [Bacteroidales bacterium]MDD4394480.1 hypothetical protein [Bacteroidales bacterium]
MGRAGAPHMHFHIRTLSRRAVRLSAIPLLVPRKGCRSHPSRMIALSQSMSNTQMFFNDGYSGNVLMRWRPTS